MDVRDTQLICSYAVKLETNQARKHNADPKGEIIREPLAKTRISVNLLWKQVLGELREHASEQANASIAAFKQQSELIEARRSSQVASIQERAEAIQSRAKKSFWAKLFGGIAEVLAIVTMSAVAIGTGGIGAFLVPFVLITVTILPGLVDLVLKQCGVDEKTRNTVKMSLNIAKIVAYIVVGGLVAKGAATAAKAAKASNLAPTVLQNLLPIINTVGIGAGASASIAQGFLHIDIAKADKDIIIADAKAQQLNSAIDLSSKALGTTHRLTEQTLEKLKEFNESYRTFVNVNNKINMGA